MFLHLLCDSCPRLDLKIWPKIYCSTGWAHFVVIGSITNVNGFKVGFRVKFCPSPLTLLIVFTICTLPSKSVIIVLQQFVGGITLPVRLFVCPSVCLSACSLAAQERFCFTLIHYKTTFVTMLKVNVVFSPCECCTATSGLWVPHPVRCSLGGISQDRMLYIYNITVCDCQPCNGGTHVGHYSIDFSIGVFLIHQSFMCKSRVLQIFRFWLCPVYPLAFYGRPIH